MFAADHSIVDFYAEYLDALGREGKFYRRPLAGGFGPKYGNQPVGINKLKSMIKIICSRAGLVGNFTNHSGKRTCATQLYMAGVDEQDIMARTGHRSEKGVRKYKQACEAVQKRVSAVLDPPCLKRKMDFDSDGSVQPPAKRQEPLLPTSEPLRDISNQKCLFQNCQVYFQWEPEVYNMKCISGRKNVFRMVFCAVMSFFSVSVDLQFSLFIKYFLI